MGGLFDWIFGGDGETTTTNAPWGPAQPYIMDMLSRAGGAAAAPLVTQDQNAAQAEMGKWASGENMNPLLGVNNPYLQAVIDSSSQDAMRNLQPMFNRANAASGSFGNSGVAEAQGRYAGETLGNIATKARMADYTQQQGLFENDAARRITAGGLFQQQANYEQQMPWQNVNNYARAIGGTGGGSTSQPYYSNPMNTIAGIGGILGSWGS